MSGDAWWRRADELPPNRRHPGHPPFEPGVTAAAPPHGCTCSWAWLAPGRFGLKFANSSCPVLDHEAVVR